MIQSSTKLRVLDNSGATSVVCIGVLNKKRSGIGVIGDVLSCSIRSVIRSGKVQRKEVRKALIVNQKSWLRRSTGSSVCFLTNAVILLDGRGVPLGTRVRGVMPRELRVTKYSRVLSLADRII